MAVVNVLSTQITNRDATPRVINNPAGSAGELQQPIAVVAVANGDSIASTYRLCQIPSNAYGETLKLYCGAITSGAANFGIYRTTIDGGAVVNASFYAAAQSIASAITTGTEIQLAGGTNVLADFEKPLWQRLGLSADPGVMYDVVMTLTAAAAAAGSVGVKLQYADT